MCIDLCYKSFQKISRKLNLVPKNTIIDKRLTYASETSTIAKRDIKY
jgi:hypothetical protein